MPFFSGLGRATTDIVVQGAQLTASALRAPPPLALEHGYAHEGAPSGSEPPIAGAFEIVNKTPNAASEVIAVIVATNAIDLLKGGDIYGYLNEYLRRGCMPNMTVMHGSFVPTVEAMQILLLYGAKWPTVEASLVGHSTRCLPPLFPSHRNAHWICINAHWISCLIGVLIGWRRVYAGVHARQCEGEL